MRNLETQGTDSENERASRLEKAKRELTPSLTEFLVPVFGDMHYTKRVHDVGREMDVWDRLELVRYRVNQVTGMLAYRTVLLLGVPALYHINSLLNN